jgi:hypothetical protein
MWLGHFSPEKIEWNWSAVEAIGSIFSTVVALSIALLGLFSSKRLARAQGKIIVGRRFTEIADWFFMIQRWKAWADSIHQGTVAFEVTRFTEIEDEITAHALTLSNDELISLTHTDGIGTLIAEALAEVSTASRLMKRLESATEAQRSTRLRLVVTRLKEADRIGTFVLPQCRDIALAPKQKSRIP